MPSTLGFHPKPGPTLLPLMQKSRQKRSSPCILADLPRLAPGTKRTRLRLKQLFVLSFASPGRCPSADAKDGAALESFFITMRFLSIGLCCPRAGQAFTLCLQLQRVNRESRRCACSPKNHLFATLKAMNSVRNWILCIQDVFAEPQTALLFHRSAP